MRILHLADLHLGWQPEFLGEKKEERTRERDNFLRRAVDFALDSRNRIHVVLIAGDLFEVHNPSRPLVEMALSQLQRLVKNNIFLLTVPGNHDEITYHDSVYRAEAHRWPGYLATSPMPREIARLELDGKTTSFYGMAYTGGLTKTSPPLETFPKEEADRHVAVLHGSLDWDTGDRSMPISSAAVAGSGYDCLAMGHIHRFSTRFLGKTTACYAGAVEAKTFHDPGTGMFTVLSLGESVNVERVDAACRLYQTKELDLNLCDTFEDVARTIAQWADPQLILRIVLKGQVNYRVDPAALQEANAHLFYHLQVDSEGVYLDLDSLASLAGEPTIRGYFTKRLLARLEGEEDDTEIDMIKKALTRGIAALRGGGE
ncbi:MAG: DNA repair exonuclease [Clostridiales bacterium]|jgi:DNA repair exonuclease SbcCD nuclease subunit|nr:DNA repair exonuclease [Clostridiales bacterium]